MKLPEIIKKLKITDWVLIVLFIAFIVAPISIPGPLSVWIDHPLGVAVLLLLTIYLFYIHPIVGVLFIWVAYELVHRASKVSHTKIPIMNYTNPTSQQQLQKEILETQTVQPLSLEEETVVQYGVYETNPVLTHYETSFHPIYDYTHNASPV